MTLSIFHFGDAVEILNSGCLVGKYVVATPESFCNSSFWGRFSHLPLTETPMVICSVKTGLSALCFYLELPEGLKDDDRYVVARLKNVAFVDVLSEADSLSFVTSFYQYRLSSDGCLERYAPSVEEFGYE